MLASEVEWVMSEALNKVMSSAGSARKPTSISRRAPIVPKAVPISMAARARKVARQGKQPTSAIASAAVARGRSVESVGTMAQASVMQPNLM
jgi:hypothetical protein